MSKLPPPMNLEGMNLEAIHEAIQDCHDWPGRNHPDDTYHLGMRAVCTAMRLESALEAAQQEIADLKRGGVDAAELDAISDAIRCIGDDAQYASTGPFVPDPLWVIGSRAYDVCTRIDGIRTIPADRELMRLVDELIRWHGLRPLDKRPDHAAVLVGAIKALRAQPTPDQGAKK